MNQPPLQCRILPDSMLFAALNLKLLSQTDSNAARLPHKTRQLGSVHPWSGVSNGPKTFGRGSYVSSPSCTVALISLINTQLTLPVILLNEADC